MICFLLGNWMPTNLGKSCPVLHNVCWNFALPSLMKKLSCGSSSKAKPASIHYARVALLVPFRRLAYMSPLDIEKDESRDDFIINIDESTNHLDISSMQTFSPFC